MCWHLLAHIRTVTAVICYIWTEGNICWRMLTLNSVQRDEMKPTTPSPLSLETATVRPLSAERETGLMKLLRVTEQINWSWLTRVRLVILYGFALQTEMSSVFDYYGTNPLLIRFEITDSYFFLVFAEPPWIPVHLLFWAEPVGAWSPRPALGRLKGCLTFCWEIVNKTEIHQSHWGTVGTELWHIYRTLKITCVNVKTCVFYIMASVLKLWGCRCLMAQSEGSHSLPPTFWSFSCSQLVTGWTVAAGNLLIKHNPHLDICPGFIEESMEEFSCCNTHIMVLTV